MRIANEINERYARKQGRFKIGTDLLSVTSLPLEVSSLAEDSPRANALLPFPRSALLLTLVQNSRIAPSAARYRQAAAFFVSRFLQRVNVVLRWRPLYICNGLELIHVSTRTSYHIDALEPRLPTAEITWIHSGKWRTFWTRSFLRKIWR